MELADEEKERREMQTLKRFLSTPLTQHKPKPESEPGASLKKRSRPPKALHARLAFPIATTLLSAGAGSPVIFSI